jgi:regulator of protease activity HflC (stomatin/prohibitin superfamily)
LASSWFRQNSAISTRPAAGNANRWAAKGKLNDWWNIDWNTRTIGWNASAIKTTEWIRPIMNNEPILLLEESKSPLKKRLVFVLGFGAAMILCIGILVLNGSVLIGSDQRGVVISAFEPNGYRAEPLAPGFHWIGPFVESVQKYSIAPQAYTMSSTSSEGAPQGDDSIRARTKDGQEVLIDASVIYEIDPTQLIELHITWQNRYEEGVVRPITRGVIRDVFLEYNAAEIDDDRKAAIQRLIENEIKQKLLQNYLILLDFTIQAVRLNWKWPVIGR